MTGAEERPPYIWSHTEDFVSKYRDAINPDPHEFDLIQIAIDEVLLWDPEEVSKPLGPDTNLRYFRTEEHPGTSHLPKLILVFEIAERPADQPPPYGLVVGTFIGLVEDLREGWFYEADEPSS